MKIDVTLFLIYKRIGIRKYITCRRKKILNLISAKEKKKDSKTFNIKKLMFRRHTSYKLDMSPSTSPLMTSMDTTFVMVKIHYLCTFKGFKVMRRKKKKRVKNWRPPPTHLAVISTFMLLVNMLIKLPNSHSSLSNHFGFKKLKILLNLKTSSPESWYYPKQN